MEERFKNIETIIESAESFGKTSVELIKLKTVDKVADGASSIVAWTAVIITLILCFTILNFGIALWIGDMFDKVYLGFLIVAGFYAIIGIILLVFKNKWIKKPLYNSIINQMLN